jgi:glycosyltransferase involved in cell wall biosynthesis
MAAGLPIVMQAGGEAARLLREADAGLCVPPQQYEALQKALGALRQATWEQRIHWGRQARQAALRHYDRPRLAQRLAAWVASLFP